MSKVNIFWDNSNIHFVGLNNVMPVKEPNENSKAFRSYFKGLLQLAHRGRETGKIYLAGSIPPQNDSLWDYIKSLGIEVELLERTAENRENANDVSIQAAMLRTAMDSIGNNETFVVMTGDGAGGMAGVGFLADLRRIKEKMGHNIELIAWDNCCNRYLKEYVENNGKYIPLEGYYENVTFLTKGRRRAKEFNSEDLIF